MEDENVCESCKYGENNSNKRPCNICMQWIDGYLDATEYEPKEY